MPINYLIQDKKLGRMASRVYMNCGLSPCCCAIPKGVARRKQLPVGLRGFKKRPKGISPK